MIADVTPLVDANPVDVSVVVATFDEARWDDLCACVSALGDQTTAPVDVIVVVDHNPRLLAEAKEQFPAATVVDNHHARGLAGARNAGIAAARGSIVAFVDDDARPEPDWLEHLSACFADPTAVGAGGALLPRWTKRMPEWLPTEFYWVFGCSYTGLPEHLAPVRNPIGANMAVRKRTLEEIGGFREAGAGGAAARDPLTRSRARAGKRSRRHRPRDPRQAALAGVRSGCTSPRPRCITRSRGSARSLSYFLRRSFEEGAGKARLAAFVGSRDGLSSERRHLGVVLPRGIARGLRQLLDGDPNGGLRALAIVVGVVVERRRLPPCDASRAPLEAVIASDERRRAASSRAGVAGFRAGANGRRRDRRALPDLPAGGPRTAELVRARRCAWFAFTESRSAWSRSTCPRTGSPPTRSRHGSSPS